MTPALKTWIARKPVKPELAPCPACKGSGFVGIRSGCALARCQACAGRGVIEIRKDPEIRRCAG